MFTFIFIIIVTLIYLKILKHMRDRSIEPCWAVGLGHHPGTVNQHDKASSGLILSDNHLSSPAHAEDAFTFLTIRAGNQGGSGPNLFTASATSAAQ